MAKTLTEHLAAFGASLSFEALSPAVVEMAKKCLLDWLGSVLAGSTQRPAVMARRVVQGFGGHPDGTVFGVDWQTGVAQAAFLNGLSSHIVELDDLHRSSTLHPGAPVISAAVATAEREDASGQRLIEAIVVGYEVAIRIAEAVNPSHYRFWHNTATCGTFGAAAAVAKVLDLEEPAFTHALGSAGSQAAGLWEFIRDGAMTKHLHTGQAAQNGVIAGYLAREGFTGARAILEGEQGFFKAMAVNANPHRITEGLGQGFKIMETSFKFFPCCGHAHSAIAAALELRRKHDLNPAAIEQVNVRTYGAALAIVGNPNPSTPYEAKFSLPYTVAAALAHGQVSLGEFEPQALVDPLITQIRERTRVLVDPDHDRAYPRTWSATVEVMLQDGSRLSENVDRAPGEEGHRVPFAELEWKYNDLIAWARRWSVEEGDCIARYAGIGETVRRMETLRSLDALTRGTSAGR